MLAIVLLAAPLGGPATAAPNRAVTPVRVAQAESPGDAIFATPSPTDGATASPAPAASDASPTPKPKYTSPPLLIPLRSHARPPASPQPSASAAPAMKTKATYTSPPMPHPYTSATVTPLATPSAVPASAVPASAVPASAVPAATPTLEPTATPTEMPSPAATPTLEPTATPTLEPTATPAPATATPSLEPSPASTATSRPGGVPHATVAPSLPTVAPVVTPTLPPLSVPLPGNGEGAPSAGTLIKRAIAAARAETAHPYLSYHLHKRLVVSEAFSQDVAYDVVERASDRLTRFQDVTTGTVRIGPPEPRRPDMPPALWGPDARDVNAGIAYAAAPSLLDAVHYDARVVGSETVGSALAYRVLLEPHDGGLHDVLRSILVDASTGRIVEVVTRRVVPLRISVGGHVRDVEIPADVTIDYTFVDDASVISRLRLLGDANGRNADFEYDIDRVTFPASVPDDTFKPSAAKAPVPAGAAPDDAVPALPSFNGAGVTFIALGDSLTVGVGTNECRGGCVTTPTRAGSGTDVPGAIQDLALAMRAAGAKLAFVPLGVTGANTGEAPKSEDPGSGDILANSGQLLQLGGAIDAARQRGDRIVVSLWSGSDDVFDAFYATECLVTGGKIAGATTGRLPCASAGTTLAGPLGDVTGGSFYHGYLRVLRAIALSKPDVIVAMNVGDLSRLPKSLVFTDGERRRLAHDVDLANEAIVDALRDSAATNAALVDLFTFEQGRPELFSAPYVSVDGLHPSDLGYRAIAAAIAGAAGGRIAGAP